MTTSIEPQSVRLVQKSVGLVADHPVELAQRFYFHLFTLAPEARAMFPTDMTAQTDKLCRALVATIEGLGTPWSIEPHLRQLGADHLKYGVRPEHYVPVGQALLCAVREIAHGEWESSIGTAWVDVFEYLAEAMQAGAAEAQRFGRVLPAPERTAPRSQGPRHRVGAGQVGAGQAGAGQAGAGQAGAGQVGAGQAGAGQVRAGRRETRPSYAWAP